MNKLPALQQPENLVIDFSEPIALLARVLQQKVAWHTLSGHQQDELVQLAIAHQVFPTLYKLAEAPEQYKTNALWYKARSIEIERQTKVINELLCKHNIPILWMKGVIIAHDLYEEPWLRPMRDIDCITPMSRRMEALSILMDANYHQVHPAMSRYGLTPDKYYHIKHHFNLFDGNISIELHYDLHTRRQFNLAISVLDYLWDYTRAIDTPAGRLQCFSPELMFVTLSMHDIVQHQQRQRVGRSSYMLYRTFDLFLLLQKHAVNWALVAQHAAHFRCQSAVLHALKDIQALFDLPVNLDMTNMIEKSLTEHESQQPSIHKTSTYQIAYDHIKSARRVLSTWQLLWYIWERALFPQRAVLRSLYQLDEDVWLWPYYAQRILHHLRPGLKFCWQWILRKSRFGPEEQTL